MEPREYHTLAEHEDHHWWFRGTRRVVASLATARLPADRDDVRVLDVGCGTGGALAALPERWRRFGVEPEPYAVARCHARGLRGVVRGDARRLPFQSEAFDLVMALDVLEHIDDDRAALGELVRVLRPGGWLLITVPAHPALWSEHDEALHHVRRYRRPELRALLAHPALAPPVMSYYNCALFPAVATVRAAQRAMRRLWPRRHDGPRSDVRSLPRWINDGLAALLAAERHALGPGGPGLPFGVSLIATAQRRGEESR